MEGRRAVARKSNKQICGSKSGGGTGEGARQRNQVRREASESASNQIRKKSQDDPLEHFLMEGHEAANWLAQGDGGAHGHDHNCNSKTRKVEGACGFALCCHLSLSGGTVA